MAGDVASLKLEDWIKLLNNYYLEKEFITRNKKNQKTLLKTVIKDSIPSIIRPHAYLIFSGGFIFLKKQLMGEDFPYNFSNFLEMYHSQKKAGDLFMETEKEKTGQYPIKNKPKILTTLDQIDKDLKRTYFPQDIIIREHKENGDEMDYFEEIEELEAEIEQMKQKVREVLICFALARSKIGYVQGMNSIVAAIVYNFFVAQKIFKEESRKEETKKINEEMKFRLKFNSEEIFYILCGLMEFFKLDKLFGEGLGVLQDRIIAFENFFETRMPDLHDKMCGSGVRFIHF